MNKRDKRICINEDCDHFYAYLDPEEITESSIRDLVDLYAGNTQVGQILFNVNVQRALFNSKTWQTLYDGYDPAGGDDQEIFQWVAKAKRTVAWERRKVHMLWLMAQKGLDHFAIWLDQCRRQKVAGWLSVRMNDCHWVNNENSKWHSGFWSANPGLRIVTHRNRRGWGEHSLNFEHEEVRSHYLNFIRELFERYDMDGLELDWMRFGYCLPYGREKASRGIITDFMSEVRRLSRICSDRTGRGVKLGVRVPDNIQTCLSLGYDVIDWIKSGMVEQITISGFYADHWLDFPVETWQAVIDGRPVDLAVCLNANIKDPISGTEMPDTAAIYRGSAGTALAGGADKIYLFNTCYLADMLNPSAGNQAGDGSITPRLHPTGELSPYDRHEQNPRDNILNEILSTCGELDTITGKSRRYILSNRQFAAPGEPECRKIPVSLRRCPLAGYSRIGQIIPLRFNIGPGPDMDERVFIHLGFDQPAMDQAGTALQNAEIWINGVICNPVDGLHPLAPITDAAAHVVSWTVVSSVVNAGENLVEYNAPASDGNIVWAEIDIIPGQQ